MHRSIAIGMLFFTLHFVSSPAKDLMAAVLVFRKAVELKVPIISIFKFSWIKHLLHMIFNRFFLPISLNYESLSSIDSGGCEILPNIHQLCAQVR